MLSIPSPPAVKVITNDTANVGSLTPWTAVTSGAANTYGSAVELISAASNTQDSWGVEVMVYATGASATASQTCVDILIGGATDDVLIPGLLCGGAYNASIRSWYFPVHVPAGVRVAAQSSSARATLGVRVGIRLYGGCPPPHKVGRKVTAYGTKSSNSRGQGITPTASGGAASVTELPTGSSTVANHFAFLPSFQLSVDTAIAGALLYNVGIGVGAATEERIGTWWFSMDSQEAQAGPFPNTPVYREVPSGTRLTMLVSGSGVNESNYDGLILAVS